MTFLCDRRQSFAVLLALAACRAWAAYVAVPDVEHVASARRHTGIPSMAAAKGGRLWVTFYGSPTGGEDSNNYCTLATSADEGKTWEGGLLIDARVNASYPDGDQAADGLIHVVYDHDRLGAQEILMASFTEEDVLAGKAVSGRSRFRQTVSSKKRQASPQEVKGRRIVENGFAVKGLFFKRAWSRNRLEFSLAGDGAISGEPVAEDW